MNLFIQGMRRSGTTILYDSLREDRELRCFYEPLREDDATPGGGSGERPDDAFAETRRLRERFRADHYPDLPSDQFNWGGPRRPELELESDLPDHCRQWLSYLLDQGQKVAIKETRLYSKLPAVAALDPGAAVVHVVRDPRAVASSIVLGRGRRQLERLTDANGFFADRKPRKLWSSRVISEVLLGHPEHADIRDPSNVLRVLLVWKRSFEVTRRDGQAIFGDRYLMLRNEDLRADPADGLSRIYQLLGRAAPQSVIDWARQHVRPAEPPFAASDPRWAEELRRGGLDLAVEQAGYSAQPAATLEK